MKLLYGMLAVGLSVLVAVVSTQSAWPGAEPTRGLAGFEDRTPLLADPADLAYVVDYARQHADRLALVADVHAEARRRDLAAASGQNVADYSPYRDLLRFPQANRGRPVALRGSVKQTESVQLDGRDATLVQLVPHDSTSGTVAVLIDAKTDTPADGEDIGLVGIFLKLAEMPGDAFAPLLVAGAITSEARVAGVLPDRSLWSVVRHRTRGVRSSESPLYYRLLRHAASVDANALRAAAAEHIATRRQAEPKRHDRERFPVFVDLFQHPEEYEGEAVTLAGYARQVRTYPAGQNAEGLETLYEVWLYTDDSQSNPAVVVASDVSGKLPVGDDLQVPVRATGYFFKIYAYRAHDTTRVASMILAGTIERLAEPELSGPPWWLIGLLATVFLAMVVWLVVSYAGTRPRRTALPETPPDFSDLSDEGERPE